MLMMAPISETIMKATTALSQSRRRTKGFLRHHQAAGWKLAQGGVNGFLFSRVAGVGEGGAKRRMKAGLRSKMEPRKLPSMTYTPRKSLSRAKNLRREQTEAEKSLWGCLRSRRLNGHKFIT